MYNMKKSSDKAEWWNYYVGLKFKDHGRDESGVDCYGLVRLVLLDECNIALPMMSHGYKHVKDYDAMEQMISDSSADSDTWLPVLKGQEQPFDVVVAMMNGYPVHIAIVAKKNHLLHIQRGFNATIEDYRRGEWRLPGKIVGIYRHKDLCNYR